MTDRDEPKQFITITPSPEVAAIIRAAMEAPAEIGDQGAPAIIPTDSGDWSLEQDSVWLEVGPIVLYIQAEDDRCRIRAFPVHDCEGYPIADVKIHHDDTGDY